MSLEFPAQLLKKSAGDSLVKRIKDEDGYLQYALFDLKHDFAQEWYKAMLGPSGSKFLVTDIKSRLPYFTNIETLEVTDVKIVDDSNSTISETINQPTIGSLLSSLDIDFSKLYQGRLWILIEYVIK